MIRTTNKNSRVSYLKIAGFFFQFYFGDSKFEYQKEKIVKELLDVYRGFLLDKKPQHIHYYFDFKDRLHFKLLYDKNDENQYFSIAKGNLNTSNKIIIYYQIGIYQFQLILRDILVRLLLHHHGFLLHASANNYKGKAIIFAGHPGAGKSTAMTYTNDKYPALADDIVIIKKEINDYVFYQTPIIEKATWINKLSSSFNIGKIFFPRKAKYFRIERITRKDMVAQLLLEQFWTKNEGYMKIQAKSVLEFISKFRNFYFLFFSKDKTKLLELLKLLK